MGTSQTDQRILMHSKAKGPTKAERKRMDSFHDIGCVCCRQDGHFRPATVQHVIDGGKRKGHGATYGSCDWHHLGIPPGLPQLTIKQAKKLLGPSLKHDARKFHKRYGSEAELVAYQNTLLAQCGGKA